MWRRSWARQNIFGENGNGECSKRKLLPEERSVWDDYLDMATPPITPISGQVCISADIGYTVEQLTSILKTDAEVIRRANKHMEELGMITVENNGIVVINNYFKYQSEYSRQKAYREVIHQDITGESNKPKLQVEKRREEKRREKYIRKEYKDIYIKLLNHWNSLKIIRHKVLEHQCYGTINAKLDGGYTAEEIIQSMNNYVHILNDRRYFWTYKWTIYEFIKRGLDKFMDLEVAKKNYADKFRTEEDDDVTSVRRKIRERR
jgi:hypothetical protein